MKSVVALQILGAVLLQTFVQAQSKEAIGCLSGALNFQLGSFSATFDTYCGYDIPKFDFPSQKPAQSFADCQTQCVQAHPLCYAFSYEASSMHSPNNCYLKNQAVPSSAVTLQSYHMDSAILDRSTVQAMDDCQSLTPQKTSANSIYIIFCGRDIVGGDLLTVPALSMSECIDTCEGNHDCQALAYEASQQHGLENCYLKKAGYPDPKIQSFPIAAATRATVASTSSRSTSSSVSSTAITSSITSPTSSMAIPPSTDSSASTTVVLSSSTSTTSTASASRSTNSFVSASTRTGPGPSVGCAALIILFMMIRW